MGETDKRRDSGGKERVRERESERMKGRRGWNAVNLSQVGIP